MGYDLRCKLFTYDSKENKCHVISQGWINELKTLNRECYSSTLSDIKECKFEHDLSDVNTEDGEEQDGNIYDVESFCNASKELEHKMDESIRKIIRFENLMTSIDYFKLTEEQRESFLETLETEKSLYNEYKDKNEVCNYLIGIMNYFADEEMDETYGTRDSKVYLFVIAE